MKFKITLAVLLSASFISVLYDELNTKNCSIDSLFEIIPQARYIYKELYVKIDDLTNEQLFEFYKELQLY